MPLSGPSRTMLKHLGVFAAQRGLSIRKYNASIAALVTARHPAWAASHTRQTLPNAWVLVTPAVWSGAGAHTLDVFALISWRKARGVNEHDAVIVRGPDADTLPSTDAYKMLIAWALIKLESSSVVTLTTEVTWLVIDTALRTGMQHSHRDTVHHEYEWDRVNHGLPRLWGMTVTAFRALFDLTTMRQRGVACRRGAGATFNSRGQRMAATGTASCKNGINSKVAANYDAWVRRVYEDNEPSESESDSEDDYDDED